MNFIKESLENLKKEKFIHNWGVDLTDMQSLSKYNKGIKYLLCAIDLFSKYAWVVPIKHQKGTSIINAFKKLISKPNKIWVHEGSEFYDNTFEKFKKKPSKHSS